MKNKISFITLIACAAAGTQLFAADPGVAFRSSSGTTKNSTDAIYVGNEVWGTDSKALGEKYFADIYSARGLPFLWDADKKAFYTNDYIDYNYTGNKFYTVKHYDAFDAVFALDDTASFVNEVGATLTFRYEGDKGKNESDFNYNTEKKTYSISNKNNILLSGTLKFENRGEIWTERVWTGSIMRGSQNLKFVFATTQFSRIQV